MPLPKPEEVSSAEITETWESAHQKIISLGIMIMKHTLREGIKLDLIAVIPRGGLYPVNILSRLLKIPGNRVILLGLSKYDPNDPMHDTEKFEIGQLPPKDMIEGKNVLLPDEVHDTGETMDLGYNILKDLGAATILTAAIHYKPRPNRTSRIPDFYVQATNGWVHYPWEDLDGIGDVYQIAQSRGVPADLSI